MANKSVIRAIVVAYAACVTVAGLSAVEARQMASSPAARVQAAQHTIWDGVYTQEQAKRGRGHYVEGCSYCHGLDLNGDEVGGEMAPDLVGPIFLVRWNGALSRLFLKISDDMPKDNPGTLTPEAASDIVSFLLEVNGARAGDVPLPSDPRKLMQLLVANKPKG